MIAGGDSRTGLEDRSRMNLRIAATVLNHPDVYALCHGGDYINDGNSWREWRLWLSQHEFTTLDDGRVLPIIPTKGNHDGGPLFFEIFNLKSNTSKPSYWHNTQITKDVNIITLDTNYTANGPQEQWLKQQLATLRPKSRYLLTNYHRPLFPAVKSVPDQAAVFVPLFEHYNIDLALESDGHCIKRTAPIRNGKIDPTGITYIGEGGLGVGQREPNKDLWYLKDGYTSRGHHIYLLHFTKESLKVNTILLNGNIVDEFKLTPRSK
jgi:acid phosphatase type 7